MACLQMLLAAAGRPVPGLVDLGRDCEGYGGYRERDDGGLDAALIQFGQAPQIRLIVQPVKTNADGTVHVDDLAVHLIFDFTKSPAAPAQQGCNVRFVPDDAAFGSVVADVVALLSTYVAVAAGDLIFTGTPAGVGPIRRGERVQGSIAGIDPVEVTFD